eukprot:COSAG02_NODE_1877_length_10559_cov_8.819025_14_plen_66_part_00
MQSQLCVQLALFLSLALHPPVLVVYSPGATSTIATKLAYGNTSSSVMFGSLGCKSPDVAGTAPCC